MITNFEEYTYEVSEEEKFKIIPLLIDWFKPRIGSGHALSNQKICDLLLDKGIKTSPPRIRKVIHHIRVTGKVKMLMSNSKGYYIAESQEEMDAHVLSLRQRIRSIQSVANALEIQAFNHEFDNTQFKLL